MREIARRVGTDEAAVRRYLTLPEGRKISDATIEHYGIALVQDPRLTARLYPKTDY